MSPAPWVAKRKEPVHVDGRTRHRARNRSQGRPVIALLGIGNTLALPIFERTRELGVLRAVGMTRAQLRSTIRWESVIIALQGTVLGLIIGVFFGWALVRALADQGVDTFNLPVTNLLIVVVLGAGAGVLAAAGPGRRAPKLNVLQAIAAE